MEPKETKSHRELRRRRTSGGARPDGTPKKETKQLVSDELAFCALALSVPESASRVGAQALGDMHVRERHTRSALSRNGKSGSFARALRLRVGGGARGVPAQRLSYAAWAPPPVVRARPARRRSPPKARWRKAPLFRTKALLRERAWWMRSSSARSASCASTSDHCGLHYRQALLTSKLLARARRRATFRETSRARVAHRAVPRPRGALGAQAVRLRRAPAMRQGRGPRRAGPSDARRERRAETTTTTTTKNAKTKTKRKRKRKRERAFFSALLAEELAFADARVSTRDDSASRDDSDATPDPSAVHPSWAEHPAAEQARFAAAAAMGSRGGAARGRGAVGAAGAARRAAAAEALAAAWPWARRRRVGCVARASAAARAAVRERLSSVTVSDTKARSARSSSRGRRACVAPIRFLLFIVHSY